MKKTFELGMRAGDSPRLRQSNSFPIVLPQAPPLSFPLARDDDGANAHRLERDSQERPERALQNASR